MSYKYNMYPFFRYKNMNYYTYNNDYTNTIFKKLNFINNKNLENYEIINDNNSIFIYIRRRFLHYLNIFLY